MILDETTRREKLKAIRDGDDEPQGQQKLFYKGQTERFDVYRVDLDYLIYNRHNGRLEAEMLTWQTEHSVDSDHYDDALHKILDRLLWESDPARNKRTLKDLELKQQQRPGIVSLDGVIIDGNRRAMLLNRIEQKKDQPKQYFDAIILPDAYADNQKEIVRLETQYQMGEDAKVDYGPLQKYLHVKRLHRDLDIDLDEIDESLMNQPPGTAQRLLDIMDLMDEYLHHISCPGLYLMLKETSGSTKEGMFVDLYGDLRRLERDDANVDWPCEELDIDQLKIIHFDFIRLNNFSDSGKSYRQISHQSSGKNFFAISDIWKEFEKRHIEHVEPVSVSEPTLEEFIGTEPSFESKMDAARARSNKWESDVSDRMKENFGRSSYTLDDRLTQLKPKEYLERAYGSMCKVDLEELEMIDEDVEILVRDINNLSYEMKKVIKKTSTQGQLVGTGSG